MKLQLKASECYKRGEWNEAKIEMLADNICDVIIYRQGWKKPYRFKARNIYQANEEILEDDLLEE